MHGPSPPGYIMGFLAVPMGLLITRVSGERWIMTCVGPTYHPWDDCIYLPT